MALRLYSALMRVAQAAAWPVLWWLGRRVPAYRERWDERRGRIAPPASARHGIVVHAASMGEAAAALPLVRALRTARPALPLAFTCTTPTGSARILEAAGDEVFHAYLPFDTPGAVARFLDALAPRALVMLETELWPNLLAAAQARGIAVVLANGRLSKRSARRYARFPRTTQAVLAAIDLLLVQDADARERFVALGAAPARVAVTGSLKYDAPLPAGHAQRVGRFRAWAGARPLWVAASTHEGEEAVILEAHARLRTQVPAQVPAPLLVLVPRHPQRFDAVAAQIAAAGLPFQRLSEGRAVEPGSAVLLADSMGELTAWMALAEAVFMGGTLVPVGGHNPLEAMQFGVPLLAGPERFNFAGAFAALAAADAVRDVHDAAGLAAALQALRNDPLAARAMGERGRAVHAREGGATTRTLAPLLALLDRRAARDERRIDGQTIWSDPALLPDAAPGRFDPASGEARGGGSGRGTVWFVRAGAEALVLRHYRRGGLVGRLVADRYLRVAPADTRGLAEFALLQRLVGWGLDVPRPAAARCVPAAPWHYRADILVRRLPGADDLSVTLQRRALSADEWRAVGAAVGRLHAHGVDHADLNCHNLMHDAGGRVWIIDFDRGAVRAEGGWRAANLARLLRSLRKEATRLPAWHWREDDWPALLAGYEAAYLASSALSASTSPTES